ncbi:hypothetical protein STEG23_031016 [Scotinomys teguina]
MHFRPERCQAFLAEERERERERERDLSKAMMTEDEWLWESGTVEEHSDIQDHSKCDQQITESVQCQETWMEQFVSGEVLSPPRWVAEPNTQPPVTSKPILG